MAPILGPRPRTPAPDPWALGSDPTPTPYPYPNPGGPRPLQRAASVAGGAHPPTWCAGAQVWRRGRGRHGRTCHGAKPGDSGAGIAGSRVGEGEQERESINSNKPCPPPVQQIVACSALVDFGHARGGHARAGVHPDVSPG